MRNLLIIIIILPFLIFISCKNKNKQSKATVSNSELKKPLQNANRAMVKKESVEIDAYVKRRNIDVTETGTGLRYLIFKNGNGKQAKKGNYALLNYKVSLLDGTVCYTTEKSGAQKILIGQDHVESGIHEGLELLHEGDKALFILPPYIAHGLIGDQNKIPPMATIIYEVELISLH